jgi:hypothetical protein
LVRTARRGAKIAAAALIVWSFAPVVAQADQLTSLDASVFSAAFSNEVPAGLSKAGLTPELLTNYVLIQRAATLREAAYGEPILTLDRLESYVSRRFVPTGEKLADISRQRHCLAQAVYHESRGEPEIGQWAVAAVVLNRVTSSQYPDSVCGVVFQNAQNLHRCQFSFACDGRNDDGGVGNRLVREAWVKSNLIAYAAYQQFLGGETFEVLPPTALFYHASRVQPQWATAYRAVAEIGDHVFYSAQ